MQEKSDFYSKLQHKNVALLDYFDRLIRSSWPQQYLYPLVRSGILFKKYQGKVEN